jgi:cell division topological specificity factor
VAKDRLKILLISDRMNCSPEVMSMIRADITKVISKYMKIDAENMDIQINTKANESGRGKTSMLYANIPILEIHTAIHK